MFRCSVVVMFICSPVVLGGASSGYIHSALALTPFLGSISGIPSNTQYLQTSVFVLTCGANTQPAPYHRAIYPQPISSSFGLPLCHAHPAESAERKRNFSHRVIQIVNRLACKGEFVVYILLAYGFIGRIFVWFNPHRFFGRIQREFWCVVHAVTNSSAWITLTSVISPS